jgi:hypothetical protein
LWLARRVAEVREEIDDLGTLRLRNEGGFAWATQVALHKGESSLDEVTAFEVSSKLLCELRKRV